MLAFKMFYFINRHIILSLLLGAVWIVLWGLIAAKAEMTHKKIIWKMANIIVLILSLTLTLYITIINRNTAIRECIFTPFYFLLKDNHTLSDTAVAIMNLLLFIPVGICLPYLLNKTLKQNIIITFVSAICLSAAIEIAQYIWSFGIFEIDDIIMNTAGALFASFSYAVYGLALKKYSENKN